MILAFDTSAGHVCAALLRNDAVVAARSEAMARGQAERLMPLLEEVLAEARAGWSDIGRIGVGVGPGNFTGIRISVATARGLALGLGKPAVGVNSFEAIEATAAHPGVPCVPGPRGQGYLRDTISGQPYLASSEELSDIMRDVVLLTPNAQTLAIGIARVAAGKPADGPRPAPLYIKPADAAPASDPPPVILDDA